MRKILAFWIIFCVPFCSLPAFAAENDLYAEPEKAYYDVYIDYAPIAYSVIGENIYIPVENLAYYGFVVEFDKNNNAFWVHRETLTYPTMSKELWAKRMSEKTAQKVQKSTTKVYLDGHLTTCYVTEQGETLLAVDALAQYGTIDRRFPNEMYVVIFADELRQLLEQADNVVEITEPNGTYKGQVNEEGKPEGIGMRESKNQSGLDKTTTIGYFHDGKSDGLTYTERYRTVSRTYSFRYYYFVGNVDGSQILPTKRIEDRVIGSDIVYYKTDVDGTNFGNYQVPINRIGPAYYSPIEDVFEQRIFTDGCYFELWNAKEKFVKSHIWKKDHIQYAEFQDSSSDNPYKNNTVEYTDDFYVYNGTDKVFYNGASWCIGTDAQGKSRRNHPSDGGGFYPFTIPVLLNGEKIVFDTSPIIEDGRTLVPMRAIFEAMGAKVDWDAASSAATATLGKNSVTVFVGNPTAVVNGEEVLLDVPAKIVKNRTLVPLRFVCENLGLSVDWEDTVKTVILTSD